MRHSDNADPAIQQDCSEQMLLPSTSPTGPLWERSGRSQTVRMGPPED